MNSTSPAPKSLIGNVLRRCKGKQRTAYLRGYAAEVLIAARIMGPIGAGESIGLELFGDSISPTPILNIVREIESGIIPMTEEKLRNVVMQDEGATKFLADNPWLIDVSGKSAPAKRPGPKPAAPVIAAPVESAPVIAAPIPAADEKPSANIPAAPVKKPKPASKDAPTTEPAPEAPDKEKPQEEPTTVSVKTTPEEEIQDDAPRKKRKSVEMPPDYKPEDFLPKPPPPTQIHISGLPATGAD